MTAALISPPSIVKVGHSKRVKPRSRPHERTRPVNHIGFPPRSSGFAILWRAVAFLALWLILVGGADPADRPAGIIAIVAATWASLRLLPPGGARPSPISLVRLALRFLRQSIVAGIDVAWRALDPRLPLRPGFVVYPARLPPGPALNAFCALTSLAPGTLPAGPDESGAIVIHCLDVGQPVAAHLAADEKLFVQALGGEADG
jgi:multicomponent Na+:H+ antiporter subunit E